MKKYWRFLSVATILVIILATIIGTSSASAQTVCSPATPISVPFSKDGLGTFCWQTTTLCNNINSWNISPKLEINGTSYANVFALASSIPPLNGVYTITYESTVTQFAHFEIAGPCPGGGPTFTPTNTITPAWPTETFTRTPTRGGPTATRTRTPTPPGGGPTVTMTRTATCGYPNTCVTPLTPTRTSTGVPPITNTPVVGACSPVTSTITSIPFVFDGPGTFCWQASSLGSFINNWVTTSVSINGLNVTNMFVPVGSYPAKIGGFYYVSYTAGTFGHFEAKP
jgi:hypothetical protein